MAIADCVDSGMGCLRHILVPIAYTDKAQREGNKHKWALCKFSSTNILFFPVLLGDEPRPAEKYST